MWCLQLSRWHAIIKLLETVTWVWCLESLAILKPFERYFKCDTSYPEEAVIGIVKCDCNYLHPNFCEKIPKKNPVALGKALRFWAQFDAEYAHDLETRRSVTGIFVYLNNTLIRWYSKRQHTVETSKYGSEIVACKIAVEILIQMRYTLRMTGVPLSKKTWLFEDNLSGITNGSKPESVIKKKHHSCTYNFVREAVSMGWLYWFHIPNEENRADILTKHSICRYCMGRSKASFCEWERCTTLCLGGISDLWWIW